MHSRGLGWGGHLGSWLGFGGRGGFLGWTFGRGGCVWCLVGMVARGVVWGADGLRVAILGLVIVGGAWPLWLGWPGGDCLGAGVGGGLWGGGVGAVCGVRVVVFFGGGVFFFFRGGGWGGRGSFVGGSSGGGFFGGAGVGGVVLGGSGRYEDLGTSLFPFRFLDFDFV